MSALSLALAMKQPPPRGCVLKHVLDLGSNYRLMAAASARLCVETYPALNACQRFCSSRLRAAVC